jgi:hypothetical protein
MSNNHEGAVLAAVMIEATSKGWRLFRNSVGQAWAGKPMNGTKAGGGDAVVVIERARRITYGLAVGSSDLVGWRSVTITPDMVGQTIAQFVSVECKTKAYGKTTPEQDNWLDQIAQAGGAAFLARENTDGGVDVMAIEAD